MPTIVRQQVIMPGGIGLTQQAERYLDLGPDTELLSVACGTGELELYLVGKYGCRLAGVDASAGFIQAATEKAATRGLDHLARFETGDGAALRFANASYDVVFCSGALCAFFEQGIKEFHRVLKPHGRAAISDVIWRRDDVPADTRERWTEGAAHVMTLGDSVAAFAERGFSTTFARAYHEPAWWEAYYADRGTGANWAAERDNYRHDQASLGLGLFVIEKTEQ